MDEPGLLQDIADEREIRRVLMHYARGIDRRDFELVRSCYHPGATDDHGSFQGTVEDFIPWVQTALARFDTTMHFLGNVIIELEGDQAFCETYCVAYHRLVGVEVDSIAGLRYVDRMERRAGRWAIAHRTIVVEWNRVDDVHSPGFGPSYTRGVHGSDDPVYARPPLPDRDGLVD